MIKQNGNNIKVIPVNIFSYYKLDKLLLGINEVLYITIIAHLFLIYIFAHTI